MKKIEHKLTKLTACLMYALTLFILLNVALYFMPHGSINVYSIETTELEYRAGDIITVRTDYESTVKSEAVNTIYLRCGNNIYQLKQIIYETYPTERGTVYTDVGLTPKDVFPPECVLQTKLATTVTILPWLHKTTVSVYQSNQFKVTN